MIGGMSDEAIPEYDPPPLQLDLRRPLTLEQMIRDCGDKLASEVQDNPNPIVEITVETELMMELALRVIALEAHVGLIPLEEPPISGPQGGSHGI